jgi:hypothetical protein
MFSSNTTQVSDGDYQISRSLRFNSADSAYLNRTPSTTTNRRTFTFSAWVKLSKTSDDPFLMGAGAGGQIWLLSDKIKVRLNGSPDYFYDTSAVFRDYSAWYHIVVGVDTTNATSTDRVKIYVNGTQQTIGASAAPPQNYDTEFNLASTGNNLGKWPSGSQYLNGYMTEINFVDGTVLTPSSFGETNAQTGVWQPKAYSGSYGTNGFYLNFSDNSNTTAATLGKDYSGNGNNWTPNNFSVAAGAGNDSLVDSPTSYGVDTGVGGEVRGNYATLNPTAVLATKITVVNGNLQQGTVSGATYQEIPITLAVNFSGSNKWYAEVNTTTVSGTYYPSIAISSINKIFAAQDIQGGATSDSTAYMANGQKYNNGSLTSYGSAFTSGDVVGIAVDEAAGTVVMYKNNVSQGTLASSLTGLQYITVTAHTGSNFYFNAGQRPFAYTAPSGFKALCTQNLPTPTIGATTATQAGKYFNTITWSGTSSGTTRSLTGVGFQPDWLWTKTRTTGYGHKIYDSVRGAGTLKGLNSASADPESTGDGPQYGYISAFNSDGFTGTNGTDASIPSAYFNQSGQTYVAWNWKESVTAGFDIVSYTGTGVNRTVAHNLGVAPKMIFIKATNASAFWQVYNADVGATKTMYLNSSLAAATSSNSWNDTAPTSSVFTVGTNADVNNNGTTYIAYCFAEVAGYSKFGSYTGNGSTDGPFVFTGMRPAYVMIKRTDSASSWYVWDTKRDTYNVITNALLTDTNGGDTSATSIDDLSNGFKCRSATIVNASGGTYIYMAFAENPFKYSLAR